MSRGMKESTDSLKINDGTRLNTGELATEKVLLAAGYRKYSGAEIDVFYNKDICQHVGNCVFSNPAIYEVGRKPWIITDAGDSVENQRVVGNCPTGALKFIAK